MRLSLPFFHGLRHNFVPGLRRTAVTLCLVALALALPVLDSAWAASSPRGEVDPFVFRIAIFVLAIFIGYFVVWSVTPALHTPLMSVTNAISSVIIVGALLAVTLDGGADVASKLAASSSMSAKVFGFLALVLAAVNIFGGFLVTSRMLSMYKKKDR